MHYGPDLSYIHDAAFRGQPGAARHLLAALAREGIAGGLVVDLACGSGRWAAELDDAGYEVLGVDQSDAMIRLARELAPHCRFETASLHDFELPECHAVTSLGEGFNYCFDNSGGPAAISRLFRRIHAALRPGGVLLFEIAGLERMPAQLPARGWWEGDDWTVLTEVTGNRARHTLDRRVISFRRTGAQYRRTEELHRIRLYSPAGLERGLQALGFRTRVLASYSRRFLPPGTVAIVARKPATGSGSRPARDRAPAPSPRS